MGTSANPTTSPVLLATAAGAWELDEDAPALLDALRGAEVAAAPAVWDDPTVDWASAPLVVVRSTWDYARRRDEFLQWADRVASLTTLHNPPAVLRWNTDKRYLSDLVCAELPVVDTVFLDHERRPDEVATALRAEWECAADLVVKPAVSAGSKDTGRFGPDDLEDAVALVSSIAASGRTTMVQPYLGAVDSSGETGLVYFDGAFSHAFAKGALLTDRGVAEHGLFALETIEPRHATTDELRLADEVVAHTVERFGDVPLYARVDLLRGDDGTPVLLELELAEPSWFLATDPASSGRAAAAIAGRLG